MRKYIEIILGLFKRKSTGVVFSDDEVPCYEDIEDSINILNGSPVWFFSKIDKDSHEVEL